jgi:hypothetical protein
MNQDELAISKPSQSSQTDYTRPLYVRRVPEAIWNRVHDNANRSRMRLQSYLVKIMEQSQPFLPLAQREGQSAEMVKSA